MRYATLKFILNGNDNQVFCITNLYSHLCLSTALRASTRMTMDQSSFTHSSMRQQTGGKHILTADQMSALSLNLYQLNNTEEITCRYRDSNFILTNAIIR